MQSKHLLILLVLTLVVLAGTAAAAQPPTATLPAVAPCNPGAGYDPGCDVDHNGSIDLTDVQLTAGHWNQSGAYPAGGYPAAVSRTGQMTCFDAAGATIACSSSGQDGDLQAGVPWPSPRFTDLTNGTVRDNLTGLVWLTDANCPVERRTWANALSDVVSLNTDGTMNGHDCGDFSNNGSHQTDWRLPNVRELESLLDYEYDAPALSNSAGTGHWANGDPFSNVQMFNYWTSTSYVNSASTAWYVWVYHGHTAPMLKSTTYHVWPVRGG